MEKEFSNQKLFHQYLSARNDFSHGKYKLASKKLLPISLVTDNDDVNHLLVKSLYYRHDYEAAEKVLLQDINSYTSDDSLVRLMIDVLLKNDEFIICHEIIASFSESGVKQWALSSVNRQEALDKRENPEKLLKIAKDFYHLSGVSLIKQRIVLKRAQHLPLDKFVDVSKALLIDPFLSPIMRLSILEILRKVAFKAIVKYRWIDKKVYSINIDYLQDLTATKSYRKIMKCIGSEYFHDPSKMMTLKQVLRLDLSYLYPFNDQKVRDVPLWVKIAELRLEGKQPEFLNQHIKSVYFLQVKLNQLTKNLVK